MVYSHQLLWAGLIVILLLSPNKIGAQNMASDIQDRNSVQDQITNLFVYTDQDQWDKLRAIFAETVLLDYSSFSGQKASELTSEQIVGAWSGFLPGFRATHHQVGNFQVQIDGLTAHVFCYGTASHFFPNNSGRNVWVVVGSYDFELEKNNETWQVKSMTFYFKYQDGNVDLPKIIENEHKEEK
ncbi:MAG: nuclear transport factor 2 family protein [Calditrichia bacterium]